MERLGLNPLGIQVPSQKVRLDPRNLHGGVSNHLLRRYDWIPREHMQIKNIPKKFVEVPNLIRTSHKSDAQNGTN